MIAERDKHYPSRYEQTSLATAAANITKPVTENNFGPSMSSEVHEGSGYSTVGFPLHLHKSRKDGEFCHQRMNGCGFGRQFELLKAGL